MLNLESRMEILGITVYQDSDRPDQFYYLPGPPHITVEDGTPQFELYSFRKGGDADETLTGGFLNMTVDLGIGPLYDRIKRRLEEQFGREVKLTSVPFTNGTARVIALGEMSDPLDPTHAVGGAESDPLAARGPRFIERILGAQTPSLDGDNRAIFSFSLTEEGAAFFMDVLSGSPQARPVGVVYELEYVGLLPAYDLEITIDFASSYEYLRNRFTLGTLLFKADIDNIVEELQRREAIKIRETSRTLELSDPLALRERQDRIDQLVKDLAAGALFQPSLIPGQPRFQGETITAADPTTTAPTSAPAGSPGEQGSAAARALQSGPTAAVATGIGEALSRGGASPPSTATAADGSTGTGGTGGGGGSDGSGQTDRGAGSSSSTSSTDGSGDSGGTGSSSGGSSGSGTSGQQGQSMGTPGGGSLSRQPTAADIWNQLGRPQAAYVVKQLRQEERRTVTYSLSQVTAQKQTVAPQNFIQFLSDPRRLSRQMHVVDLNHPFFERLNVTVSAEGVDFQAAGIVQMTVQLRYGHRRDGSFPKDTAEVILRSPEDRRSLTFFIDAQRTQSYEYKLIVDYRAGFGIGLDVSRLESEWTASEARTLSVRPDWVARVLPVTVQLAPNVAPDVAEAQVRVRYHHPDRGIDDSRLVHLTPEQRSATVPIRLADDVERYEVSGTLFYTDGDAHELPLLRIPDDAPGGVVDSVVIGARRSGRFDLDAIMLDPLGELASVLVDTRVTQEEATLDARTVELTHPGARHVWSVRMGEAGTPELRYRERRLYRDGGFEEGAWRVSASPNLVVGIPAEGTMTVAVRYFGPQPSLLGLMAVLIDLEYQDPDGNPQFEQRKTLLVTDDPMSHIQDWKVRLPDRQARTYTWRLTLLHADGSESQTEPTIDSREQILLRVPQL